MFVHPDAVVIGRVTIGAGASVWASAVLRGDYGEILVGERTSIQDGSVVHATAEHATVIGRGCIVGHLAHLEGCRVEDGALIGSGAVVLHEAVIGAGAAVGANAVVPNGTRVPPLALALGVPARIRENAVPPGAQQRGARRYTDNGRRYRDELRRLD